MGPLNAEAECPICTDELSPTDVLHPPQCAARCGYNFCLSCVESLISSSRDDYLEASDGNRHVKVLLQCPNCRSDLSPTIRDTALLRRADNLDGAARAGSDSELSASELRMKNAMSDPDVREALSDARMKEAEFFAKDDICERGGFEMSFSSECEEVVAVAQADSLTQAESTDSFSATAAWAEKEREAPTAIDATLFGGYEFCMTSDEKRFVTEMMTSGSTTKLSAAALFLCDVVRMSREGKTAASREREAMSTVKVLVDEAKAAKEKAALKAAGITAQTTARLSAASRGGSSRGLGRMASTQSDHRSYERELKRKQEYMRTHPLPVRMPKYVELELQPPTSRTFPLKFVDDIWDGTVTDVFSQVKITRQGLVDRTKTENAGVTNVLRGGSNGTIPIDKIGPIRRRVVVASIKAEGGKKGVIKGDVVTHFNGEDFNGSAAGLNAAIQSAVLCAEGPNFTLVLNADPSTAEALRRRALID